MKLFFYEVLILILILILISNFLKKEGFRIKQYISTKPEIELFEYPKPSFITKDNLDHSSINLRKAKLRYQQK